jgi:hypothetical protein
MSKIGDAMIEIEELYIAGYDATEILKFTGYPMSWIESVITRIDGIDDSEYFDESMDGDMESGLASAGFGTDEDYGSASDDLF